MQNEQQPAFLLIRNCDIFFSFEPNDTFTFIRKWVNCDASLAVYYMSTLEEVTDLLASRSLVACSSVQLVKCKNFKLGVEFTKSFHHNFLFHVKYFGQLLATL